MRTSPKWLKRETLVLGIALYVFTLVNATYANPQSGTVRPLPVPSSQAPVMRPPKGRTRGPPPLSQVLTPLGPTVSPDPGDLDLRIRQNGG